MGPDVSDTWSCTTVERLQGYTLHNIVAIISNFTALTYSINHLPINPTIANTNSLSAITKQRIKHKPPKRQNRQRIKNIIRIRLRQSSPSRGTQRMNQIQLSPQRIAPPCQSHHQYGHTYPCLSGHHYRVGGIAFECIAHQKSSGEVSAKDPTGDDDGEG